MAACPMIKIGRLQGLGCFPSAVIVTKRRVPGAGIGKRTAEYFKEFVSEVYMEERLRCCHLGEI